MDACHIILYKYTYCIVISAKCWWNCSWVEVEGMLYLNFPFLLLETLNNAWRNAYFIGVFFIVDNDVWCAFLWFLFINHFCRRKWNANGDYYIQIKHCPMKRSFLKFLRKYSDDWMKANTLILTKCYPSFHHLSTLLLSKIQSSEMSTPMTSYICFRSIIIHNVRK